MSQFKQQNSATSINIITMTDHQIHKNQIPSRKRPQTGSNQDIANIYKIDQNQIQQNKPSKLKSPDKRMVSPERKNEKKISKLVAKLTQIRDIRSPGKDQIKKNKKLKTVQDEQKQSKINQNAQMSENISTLSAELKLNKSNSHQESSIRICPKAITESTSIFTKRPLSPTSRFGSSRSGRFQRKPVMDNPGPGEYNPLLRTSSPFIKFATKKRELEVRIMDKYHDYKGSWHSDIFTNRF